MKAETSEIVRNMEFLVKCHPADYMMAFSSDYSDAMLPPENVMATFSNAVSSY